MVLMALTLALLMAAPAYAVPPANDTVAGAFTIPDGPYPVGGTTVPDITDATTTGDPPPPSCQTNATRSVWYRWTPSETGFYRVSTGADEGSATTVDDTIMAIYTSAGGNAGPFAEVPTTADTDGCDDDSATTEAFQSTISSTFTGGTTYYIVIWKFDTPAPTAGNTAVQPVIKKLPPIPPEDTADGAGVLSLDQPVEVDDSFANNDYQVAAASPCFTGDSTATTATGRDSVYTFTAPSSGSYDFRVGLSPTAPTQNLVVYLANGPPAGPAPATVACTQAFNRQSSTGGEVATDVALTAGQKIYIFVDRAVLSPGAPLHLEASAVGPQETEPDNTPAQAIPAACGIRGAVNPATEADFYSLGTPATGSRIFAMVDAGGAGPSADVDMRVNTATDTVEYDDLDSDVEFGVSGFQPVLGGTMATGVPLFLQVDRFGAAPTGAAFPYYLYALVQPPSASATPESEPNDTIHGPSAAVNNYFSGALAGPAPSTDADLYAFEANAGDPIFVVLDGDPTRNNTPVDTKLELLDSEGNVELTVDGSGSTVNLDNANPPGLFETVPSFPSEGFAWRSLTSGIHYVRVTSAVTGATGVGDYLLSIAKGCALGGGGISNPTITTTSLPDATVGTPYSETVETTSTVGSRKFSIISGNLPPGLGIDSTGGQITGTPTGAGTFSFTVEAKDSRDLADSQALTIVVHPGSGGPGGGPGADTTAPTASHLRLRNRRFRFNLSEAAAVKITIAQLLPGRRVRGTCVKQTRANRTKPPCKRAKRKGTLSFSGQAGPNTRAFSGRLRGRRLKPGLYQATLVATDAAGNRSRAIKVRFRVMRRQGASGDRRPAALAGSPRR
jgi:putative Ig domain-containing protein